MTHVCALGPTFFQVAKQFCVDLQNRFNVSEDGVHGTRTYLRQLSRLQQSGMSFITGSYLYACTSHLLAHAIVADIAS